jgi:hypothetical protein
MPAHIDYETTPIIFYKFVCENPEIKSCYVGQTTNFQQRKSSHKYRCINEKNECYNLKIYKIIRDNGDWDNWKMVEIDRQICLDKTDACKIEQQYIEELQSDMNSHFALRNVIQYRIDNKDKHTSYCKIYYLENKEFLSEYKKKYNIEHKEQVSLKHKQYNIEHRDEIAINKNRYYLENKNEILEKKKQKINCECGGKYTKSDKSKHFKTQKHIAYLLTNNNIDNI